MRKLSFFTSALSIVLLTTFAGCAVHEVGGAKTVGQSSVEAPPSAFVETAELLSYKRLRDEQNRADPPASIQEAINTAAKMDAAARFAIISLLPHRNTPEGSKEFLILQEELQRMDASHTELVRPIIEDGSWLLSEKFDLKTRTNAWLLVQHSPDLELMELSLTQIEPLALAGVFDGQDYGLLYDRVALERGRLQRYGSQLECINGTYQPAPLEDPENVNQRREQIGFPVVRLEHYLESMNVSPCD